MPQRLAVDWDRDELRFVLATTHGDTLHIELAAAVPISDQPPIEQDPDRAVGQLLRTALAEHGIRKVDGLIAPNRSSIEVIHFTLQETQSDQLPELVRDHVTNELPAAAEPYVVDFIAARQAEDEFKVTAVAIDAGHFDQFRQSFAAAGCTPKRMPVRPYASGSLFLQTAPAAASTCLLVHVLADEVDLIVTAGGLVTFWRTVRRSGAAADPSGTEQLLAEIGRTIVVAGEELGDQVIEKVFVCGGPDDDPSILEEIAAELSLPVEMFDPFQAVGQAEKRPADRPGRFAAQIGMLLDEAQGQPPAVDLLSPRQPRRPPSRRRVVVLAATLAAVVLLLLGYRTWETFAHLRDRNLSLAERHAELEKEMERAIAQRQVADAIRQWNARNVTWLDEFRDLSTRFPSARDALVLRMSVSQAREGSCVVDIEGLVRSPDVIGRMEQQLRDDFHQIRTNHVRETIDEKSHSWHFDTSIIVTKRDKQQYASPIPQ